MNLNRQRVALVDDDPLAADTLGVLLEDAGYEPIGVGSPLSSVASAAAQIRDISTAAICDHRLSPRGLANFSGAELVAKLYADRFPAVLISQYFKIDQDVSIRKFRRHIPVLLARDELSPERIAEAISVCIGELGGERAPNRKCWRTLVRVVAKDSEGGEDVLDAIVPGWHPNEAVRFPADLLGEHQHLLPKENAFGLELRFFARVNIGAEEAGDLYLSSFEPAIEPQNVSFLT